MNGNSILKPNKIRRMEVKENQYINLILNALCEFRK